MAGSIYATSASTTIAVDLLTGLFPFFYSLGAPMVFVDPVGGGGGSGGDD